MCIRDSTLGAQLYGDAAARIDTRRMMGVINTLVNFDNRFTNSVPQEGKGLYAARTYLTAQLREIEADCAGRATFYEDAFEILYENNLSTQKNLVLAVAGENPAKGFIVVGAHYDTMSRLPRDNKEFFLQPGANDNGSGIAATLELARLYCLVPRQQGVIFVLFAAEEIRLQSQSINGRVGSRNFIRRIAVEQGWNIVAMLNLDTIGSSSDENGTIIDDLGRLYSGQGASRQLARRIQAAAFVQLPDFRLVVQDREDRQNRWGDHMSFDDRGIPAARLFEGSEDVKLQDSKFDVTNDLDPNYLANMTRVALAFLLGESEGAPAPRNISRTSRIIIWEAVPQAQGYLIAQRRADEESYTFSIQPADKRGFELAPDTAYYAVGTINASSLLGPLSPEYTTLEE
jgi:hypothetical protein